MRKEAKLAEWSANLATEGYDTIADIRDAFDRGDSHKQMGIPGNFHAALYAAIKERSSVAPSSDSKAAQPAAGGPKVTPAAAGSKGTPPTTSEPKVASPAASKVTSPATGSEVPPLAAAKSIKDEAETPSTTPASSSDNQKEKKRKQKEKAEQEAREKQEREKQEQQEREEKKRQEEEKARKEREEKERKEREQAQKTPEAKPKGQKEPEVEGKKGRDKWLSEQPDALETAISPAAAPNQSEKDPAKGKQKAGQVDPPTKQPEKTEEQPASKDPPASSSASSQAGTRSRSLSNDPEPSYELVETTAPYQERAHKKTSPPATVSHGTAPSASSAAGPPASEFTSPLLELPQYSVGLFPNLVAQSNSVFIALDAPLPAGFSLRLNVSQPQSYYRETAYQTWPVPGDTSNNSIFYVPFSNLSSFLGVQARFVLWSQKDQHELTRPFRMQSTSRSIGFHAKFGSVKSMLSTGGVWNSIGALLGGSTEAPRALRPSEALWDLALVLIAPPQVESAVGFQLHEYINLYTDYFYGLANEYAPKHETTSYDRTRNMAFGVISDWKEEQLVPVLTSAFILLRSMPTDTTETQNRACVRMFFIFAILSLYLDSVKPIPLKIAQTIADFQLAYLPLLIKPHAIEPRVLFVYGRACRALLEAGDFRYLALLPNALSLGMKSDSVTSWTKPTIIQSRQQLEENRASYTALMEKLYSEFSVAPRPQGSANPTLTLSLFGISAAPDVDALLLLPLELIQKVGAESARRMLWKRLSVPPNLWANTDTTEFFSKLQTLIQRWFPQEFHQHLWFVVPFLPQQGRSSGFLPSDVAKIFPFSAIRDTTLAATEADTAQSDYIGRLGLLLDWVVKEAASTNPADAAAALSLLLALAGGQPIAPGKQPPSDLVVAQAQAKLDSIDPEALFGNTQFLLQIASVASESTKKRLLQHARRPRHTPSVLAQLQALAKTALICCQNPDAVRRSLSTLEPFLRLSNSSTTIDYDEIFRSGSQSAREPTVFVLELQFAIFSSLLPSLPDVANSTPLDSLAAFYRAGAQSSWLIMAGCLFAGAEVSQFVGKGKMSTAGPSRYLSGDPVYTQWSKLARDLREGVAACARLEFTRQQFQSVVSPLARSGCLALLQSIFMPQGDLCNGAWAERIEREMQEEASFSRGVAWFLSDVCPTLEFRAPMLSQDLSAFQTGMEDLAFCDSRLAAGAFRSLAGSPWDQRLRLFRALDLLRASTLFNPGFLSAELEHWKSEQPTASAASASASAATPNSANAASASDDADSDADPDADPDDADTDAGSDVGNDPSDAVTAPAAITVPDVSTALGVVMRAVASFQAFVTQLLNETLTIEEAEIQIKKVRERVEQQMTGVEAGNESERLDRALRIEIDISRAVESILSSTPSLASIVPTTAPQNTGPLPVLLVLNARELLVVLSELIRERTVRELLDQNYRAAHAATELPVLQLAERWNTDEWRSRTLAEASRMQVDLKRVLNVDTPGALPHAGVLRQFLRLVRETQLMKILEAHYEEEQFRTFLTLRLHAALDAHESDMLFRLRSVREKLNPLLRPQRRSVLQLVSMLGTDDAAAEELRHLCEDAEALQKIEASNAKPDGVLAFEAVVDLYTSGRLYFTLNPSGRCEFTARGHAAVQTNASALLELRDRAVLAEIPVDAASDGLADPGPSQPDWRLGRDIDVNMMLNHRHPARQQVVDHLSQILEHAVSITNIVGELARQGHFSFQNHSDLSHRELPIVIKNSEAPETLRRMQGEFENHLSQWADTLGNARRNHPLLTFFSSRQLNEFRELLAAPDRSLERLLELLRLVHPDLDEEGLTPHIRPAPGSKARPADMLNHIGEFLRASLQNSSLWDRIDGLEPDSALQHLAAGTDFGRSVRALSDALSLERRDLRSLQRGPISAYFLSSRDQRQNQPLVLLALYLALVRRLPFASEVLFASPTTTKDELEEFLLRWRHSGDLSQQLRFDPYRPPIVLSILNVQLLPYEAQVSLAVFLEQARREQRSPATQTQQGHQHVPLLLISAAPGAAGAAREVWLETSVAWRNVYPIPMVDIPALRAASDELHALEAVEVVSSPSVGSGKTHLIRTRVAREGQLYACVSIDGYTSAGRVLRRLKSIEAQRRELADDDQEAGLALHINVAHNIDPDLVNELLLQYVFLRSLSANSQVVHRNPDDSLFVELPNVPAASGRLGEMISLCQLFEQTLPEAASFDIFMPVLKTVDIADQAAAGPASDQRRSVICRPVLELNEESWLVFEFFQIFLAGQATHTLPNPFPIQGDLTRPDLDNESDAARSARGRLAGELFRYSTQLKNQVLRSTGAPEPLPLDIFKFVRYLGPYVRQPFHPECTTPVFRCEIPDMQKALSQFSFLLMETVLLTAIKFATTVFFDLPQTAGARAGSRASTLQMRGITEDVLDRMAPLRLWNPEEHPFAVLHSGAGGAEGQQALINLSSRTGENNLVLRIIETWRPPPIREFHEFLGMNRLFIPASEILENLADPSRSREALWSYLGATWQKTLQRYAEHGIDGESIESARQFISRSAYLRHLLQKAPQPPGSSEEQHLSDFFMRIYAKSLGEGFTITVDGMLKILAINQRLLAKEPVCLIGETGAGKTRILRFISDVLGHLFFVLNVHGGTTPSHVRDFLAEPLQLALDHAELSLVVFFDEINTSGEALWLFKELVCDRILDGQPIPSNIAFVSALNPYRLRNTQSRGVELNRAAGLQAAEFYSGSRALQEQHAAGAGRLNELDLSQLVYRVHMVPEALFACSWHFGSPAEQTQFVQTGNSADRVVLPEQPSNEDLYSVSLCDSVLIPALQECDTDRSLVEVLGTPQARRHLIGYVTWAIHRIHRFIREDSEMEVSAVSLRDVLRCLKFVPWFYTLFGNLLEDRWSTQQHDAHTRIALDRLQYPLTRLREAFFTSLVACYYMRLPVDDRSRFALILSSTLKSYFSKSRDAYYSFLQYWRLGERSSYRPADYIAAQDAATFELLGGFRLISSFLLDRAATSEGIARNTALRENLFMLFTCACNEVSLFLVGRPGSSKSLALDLLVRTMGRTRADDPFFKKYPLLHVNILQCSPLTRTEAVVQTFRNAGLFLLRVRESKQLAVSVPVLEEAGLADISPHVPLKVLHSLLDDGIEIEGKLVKLFTIGLSNWQLDSAKMNRGLFLSRGDPTVTDLGETAAALVVNMQQQLRGQLSAITNGLFDLIIRNPLHNWFYGLRDFYYLVKMLNATLNMRVPGHSQAVTLSSHAMLWAFLRNFGGLVSRQTGKIDREALNQLADVFSRISTPSWIQYHLSSSPDVGYCDSCALGTHFHAKSSARTDALGTSRSELLEVIRDSRQGPCQLQTPSVLQLVAWNLADKNGRHMMLVTRNGAAQDLLPMLLTSRQYVLLHGGVFAADRTDSKTLADLQQLKACMEDGRTVVLVDGDSLYESLYDMLNQHYTEYGGKRYTHLSFGAASRQSRVHDDFRCIVIAEAQTVPRLAPPFLNRFEKHVFTARDAMTESQLQLSRSVLARLRDAGQVLPGFADEDTIDSLVLAHPEARDPAGLLAPLRDVSTAHGMTLLSQRRAGPSAANDFVELRDLAAYLQGDKHDSLFHYYRAGPSATPSKAERNMFLTFSPAYTLEESELERVLQRSADPVQVTIHRLDKISSQREVQTQVARFFQQPIDRRSHQYLIYQFDAAEVVPAAFRHTRYLVESARPTDDSAARRHVIFLLHISPRALRPQVGLETQPRFELKFLAGWNTVFLDEILPVRDDFPTLSQLLLNPRGLLDGLLAADAAFIWTVFADNLPRLVASLSYPGDTDVNAIQRRQAFFRRLLGEQADPQRQPLLKRIQDTLVRRILSELAHYQDVVGVDWWASVVRAYDPSVRAAGSLKQVLVGRIRRIVLEPMRELVRVLDQRLGLHSVEEAAARGNEFFVRAWCAIVDSVPELVPVLSNGRLFAGLEGTGSALIQFRFASAQRSRFPFGYEILASLAAMRDLAQKNQLGAGAVQELFQRTAPYLFAGSIATVLQEPQALNALLIDAAQCWIVGEDQDPTTAEAVLELLRITLEANSSISEAVMAMGMYALPLRAAAGLFAHLRNPDKAALLAPTLTATVDLAFASVLVAILESSVRETAPSLESSNNPRGAILPIQELFRETQRLLANSTEPDASHLLARSTQAMGQLELALALRNAVSFTATPDQADPQLVLRRQLATWLETMSAAGDDLARLGASATICQDMLAAGLNPVTVSAFRVTALSVVIGADATAAPAEALRAAITRKLQLADPNPRRVLEFVRAAWAGATECFAHQGIPDEAFAALAIKLVLSFLRFGEQSIYRSIVAPLRQEVIGALATDRDSALVRLIACCHLELRPECTPQERLELLWQQSEFHSIRTADELRQIQLQVDLLSLIKESATAILQAHTSQTIPAATDQSRNRAQFLGSLLTSAMMDAPGCAQLCWPEEASVRRDFVVSNMHPLRLWLLHHLSNGGADIAGAQDALQSAAMQHFITLPASALRTWPEFEQILRPRAVHAELTRDSLFVGGLAAEGQAVMVPARSAVQQAIAAVSRRRADALPAASQQLATAVAALEPRDAARRPAASKYLLLLAMAIEGAQAAPALTEAVAFGVLEWVDSLQPRSCANFSAEERQFAGQLLRNSWNLGVPGLSETERGLLLHSLVLVLAYGQAQNSAVQPFWRIVTAPQSMAGSFLPSLPPIIQEDDVVADGTATQVYACNNRHIYWTDACAHLRTIDANCVICGGQIGSGNQQSNEPRPGNVRIGAKPDFVAALAALPRAGDAAPPHLRVTPSYNQIFNSEANPQRLPPGCTPLHYRLLRFCLHSAMIGTALLDPHAAYDTRLAPLISAEFSAGRIASSTAEFLRFFVAFWQTDMSHIASQLAPPGGAVPPNYHLQPQGAAAAFPFLHGFLCQIRAAVLPTTPVAPFRSCAERTQWETSVVTQIVSPLFARAAAEIRDVAIRSDEAIRGRLPDSPVVTFLGQEFAQWWSANAITPEKRAIRPSLWLCVRTVSFGEFELAMRPVAGDEFFRLATAVLRSEERGLELTRQLPALVRFLQRLTVFLDSRIDTARAAELSWAQFLETVPDEQQAEWEALFDAYANAFNRVWPRVERYDCIDFNDAQGPGGQYRNIVVSPATPLSLLLPSDANAGIVPAAALGFLAGLHNNLLQEADTIVRPQLRRAALGSLLGVTEADLPAFSGRHLLQPLVERAVHRPLEEGALPTASALRFDVGVTQRLQFDLVRSMRLHAMPLLPIPPQGLPLFAFSDRLDVDRALGGLIPQQQDLARDAHEAFVRLASAMAAGEMASLLALLCTFVVRLEVTTDQPVVQFGQVVQALLGAREQDALRRLAQNTDLAAAVYLRHLQLLSRRDTFDRRRYDQRVGPDVSQLLETARRDLQKHEHRAAVAPLLGALRQTAMQRLTDDASLAPTQTLGEFAFWDGSPVLEEAQLESWRPPRALAAIPIAHFGSVLVLLDDVARAGL
eukprot:TRINITY_DN1070_c1_g1_i5.p1 TRINITY_DN1070_c1_g1~~TRINITY_DN1070_c1_g1_i5.p1  ORF type:complete len:5524 (-),score=1141.71 TRINITY_DN1070_c1_g1_i5:23-16453(-)